MIYKRTPRFDSTCLFRPAEVFRSVRITIHNPFDLRNDEKSVKRQDDAKRALRHPKSLASKRMRGSGAPFRPFRRYARRGKRSEHRARSPRVKRTLGEVASSMSAERASFKKIIQVTASGKSDTLARLSKRPRRAGPELPCHRYSVPGSRFGRSFAAEASAEGGGSITVRAGFGMLC